METIFSKIINKEIPSEIQYEDDICITKSEPSLEIFNILLKIFSIEYENSTVSERGFSLQSINFNEPEISKNIIFTS